MDCGLYVARVCKSCVSVLLKYISRSRFALCSTDRLFLVLFAALWSFESVFHFLLWPCWFGWFACLINIRIRSAPLCRETKLDKKRVLFTSSRLFIEVFCQTSSRLACTTASFCENVLARLHAFFSPFATEMKPEKDIQYKSMLYYTTTIYTIRIKPHQGLHWGTWLPFWVKVWIYAHLIQVDLLQIETVESELSSIFKQKDLGKVVQVFWKALKVTVCIHKKGCFHASGIIES